VRRLCLVVGYLGNQIKAYARDGAAWDLRISYCHQEQQLGTAHALRVARAFLTAPSFVLAADYVLPRPYLKHLKRAYQAAGSPLAASLKHLPPAELASRSSVCFDASGDITAIVEKPARGTAPTAIGASLIYIVPPAIRSYLGDLTLSPRREYELPDVLNQMLADGYRMIGLLQAAPAEWHPGLLNKP
jgi:dTDP-glucose pyrophosphorylase